MTTTGFFVDWDGNTRRTEAPGDGYSCQVIQRDGYVGVEVQEPDSCICHEATFFATLADVEAAGVTVNLL